MFYLSCLSLFIFWVFLYPIIFVFSFSNILKVVLLRKKYDLKRHGFIMLNIFPPCFMKQRGTIKMFQLQHIFKNQLLKIFSVKHFCTCYLNIFRSNLLLWYTVKYVFRETLWHIYFIVYPHLKSSQLLKDFSLFLKHMAQILLI